MLRIIFPDPRWRDDLQLHPDQPISDELRRRRGKQHVSSVWLVSVLGRPPRKLRDNAVAWAVSPARAGAETLQSIATATNSGALLVRSSITRAKLSELTLPWCVSSADRISPFPLATGSHFLNPKAFAEDQGCRLLA